MRVPYGWLTSYCDPGMTPAEAADALAMHSIELERITHVGASSAEGFVVGRVVSAAAHPNADRLSVCEVDTGDGTRTIVCGAPNVAAGQAVPVALPGAVMPGGQELGQATLRGVVSDGMILSEAELEIGEDADGIVVLEQPPAASSAGGPGGAGSELAPGTPLAEVLPISEAVLELEPTSNRVDCFGVYGVARELHAVTGAELAPPPWAEDSEATGEGSVDDLASVTVEVPDLCPRFTARAFTEVTIAPSPLWLKARLIGAGMRPINNVVDITNYVMLLTAQPLHAFDLDRVPGGELIIRTARDGETMRTLDDVERRFDSDTVLVCDRERPTGVAGIMGGQVSEVSDATTRVLLEVANWNGVNILRTSRKLGLRSDASNRFEKQLHPALTMWAQRVASRLLVELCGATLIPGTIDEAAEIPDRHRVGLRGGRAEAVLGMPVEPSESADYLQRLEFEVERDGDDLTAVVPFHRHYDVTREADLVEEVGRIHGYAENLPATLPGTSGRAGRLSVEQRLRRRAEDVMRDLGFAGVVTLSLVEPSQPGRLGITGGDPRADPIRVSNPLSGDHSSLRTTLVGSLLDAAHYNRSHGAERIALFESGRAYLCEGTPGDGPLGGRFAGDQPAPAYEPTRLACLASGPLTAADWRHEAESVDFFAIKGVLEALLAQLGCDGEVAAGSEPFLHPGRSARLLVGGADVGWVGEMHPAVCRRWGLEGAAGFEVDLGRLVEASPRGYEQYEDVIAYPLVEQDVAVVVADDVNVASVRAAVLAGGGELLRSAELFDLYTGDQVGEGRKSVALRLRFQAPDRTLTDEEVAERRNAIGEALADIGGSLRE